VPLQERTYGQLPHGVLLRLRHDSLGMNMRLPNVGSQYLMSIPWR